MILYIPFTPIYFDLYVVYEFWAGLISIMFGMAWWPCCCNFLAPCDCCDTDTTTETVKIEFSGVVAGVDNCYTPADPCTECNDWNTTAYIANRNTKVFDVGRDECDYTWNGAVPCDDCNLGSNTGYGGLYFYWGCNGTAGGVIELMFKDDSGTSFLGSNFDVTKPRDCGTVLTITNSGNNTVCDFSSSTTTVTPIT